MNLISSLRGHFDWYLNHGLMKGYGLRQSAVWMSALDLETGRYPEGQRAAGVSQRCYRWIESPWGSNCYWDQPVFAALDRLSHVSGESRYQEAANDYVRDFLETSVSGKNGMFLWGNHYYYDAVQSSVVRFPGSAAPNVIDPACDAGEYCETRPLPVYWEPFWRCDAKKTEAAIAAQAHGAIVDVSTGEFNRHSDGLHGYPFLESGGILIMSLAWLYGKTGNVTYLEMAEKVARYSWSFRDSCTGLIINSPGSTRWDGICSSSEVGLWARCLQYAFRVSGKREFGEMAMGALESWLNFSWSEADRKFYGKLRVIDAEPLLGEPDTPYQPSRFCEPWHPYFPRHDYPFSCAQACLEAFRLTGRAVFRIGAERWIEVMETTLNASEGRVLYAEHYGRFVKVLIDAAKVLEVADYRKKAEEIAHRSLFDLKMGDRFRTHTGEHRYDSVDGFGFLALAMLNLHSDDVDADWNWLF